MSVCLLIQFSFHPVVAYLFSNLDADSSINHSSLKVYIYTLYMGANGYVDDVICVVQIKKHIWSIIKLLWKVPPTWRKEPTSKSLQEEQYWKISPCSSPVFVEYRRIKSFFSSTRQTWDVLESARNLFDFSFTFFVPSAMLYTYYIYVFILWSICSYVMRVVL